MTNTPSVHHLASQSQAHLTAVVESAMDAILAINEHQLIVLFNPAAEQIFGHKTGNVIGRSLDLLIPERYQVRHRSHIQRFGVTGVTNRTMGRLGTLYGLRANGEEFPLEASISQIQTDEGRLYTVILRDITERLRAEAALQAKNDEIRTMTQQLWQTAKLATMGELAASIAHELNNPLAILSLRVESLLERSQPGSRDLAELQIVQLEAERMAMLVANLLQFSRSAQRQISSLNIAEEIDQTLDLIHSYLLHRHVQVVREYAPDLPIIHADRQHLRQLFLNLFTNAADAMTGGNAMSGDNAMPGGGTLTIRLLLDANHDRIRIEVADTGVGIRSEDLPHVVEPFYTTKGEGKGTGLGLSICRRIVEEHGGIFRITSPGPNLGATVYIELSSLSHRTQAFLDD